MKTLIELIGHFSNLFARSSNQSFSVIRFIQEDELGHRLRSNVLRTRDIRKICEWTVDFKVMHANKIYPY